MFLCIMSTNKFYDDNSYSNKDFSIIGGIPTGELLELEIEFMDMLQYNLFIDEAKFANYVDKMNKLWKANQVRLR